MLNSRQIATGQERADAQRTPHDKWSYNLFQPTLPVLMREMSTDRPDQTESPYTVDAGHIQIEMDAVSAVFDHDESRGGNVRTTAWGTSLNVKAGLLNNADIQFVFDPYLHQRVEARAPNSMDTTPDSATSRLD